MGRGMAGLGGAIVMLGAVLALERQGRDAGYRMPEPAAAPAEHPWSPSGGEPPRTPPPQAEKPHAEKPKEEEPPARPSEKPDDAPPPAQETPSQGGMGSVEGTVRFTGEPPALAPLPVNVDKDKCGAGDAVPDESLVVDKETKGIANVVVTLEPKEGKGVPAGAAQVAFDQKHCIFTDRVAVVPAGATVDFRNSDTVGHNVNTAAAKRNAGFNQTIGGGKSLQKRFDKEEKIEVTCNIHPWMKGWLYVTDAPFYAKTDAKGHFRIENVPPGTYKVKVWQEKLAKKECWKGTFEVTVKDGAAARADFEGTSFR